MIWKGWISLLGLFVLAVTWTGCINPAGETRDKYVCVDDEIRIGDTLLISLLDVPQDYAISERQFVVRSDGTINLPNLNAVPAVGKRFGAFEREVQTNYISGGFFKRVTVVVKPSERYYSVGGEVKAPGRQQYLGQTTVLRAIVSCGDFTEFANRRRVEITRAGGIREIMDCKAAIKNPKLDRPICPGDHINIPRSL